MATLSNNELTLTIKAIDNASSVLKKVKGEVDDTTDSTSRMGESFSKLGGIIKTSVVTLGAAGAAALTAGTAIGFNFNSSVEQAQAKLMAFMKDGNKVAETLAWVKDEAAKTQFSFTEMADAAANLTPVSKSTGVALQDLIRQAEILAALNPAEGLTGATFSLREALSGDWVSIVDRFNLPRKRINELKAEGVPAMEIITRTLQEMGIEYDLVAKQGMTVSARFDQVKDKLTMMAGAAAKPIFDRVSKELDVLGAFDYQKLGEDAAGWVQGAIDGIDRLVPKVQAVWKQVSDYLAPKFEKLGQVVRDDVIPIFLDLYESVFKPLAAIVGGVLLFSFGLFIDVLTRLTIWATDAYNAIKDGLGRLKETLQPGFDWFMTNVWPILELIGRWIANEFVKAWNQLTEAVRSIEEQFKKAGINIDLVQVGLGLLAVAFVALVAPIVGAIVWIVALGLAILKIVAFFAQLTAAMHGFFNDMASRLGSMVYFAKQAAWDMVKPFIEAFQHISRAWDSMARGMKLAPGFASIGAGARATGGPVQAGRPYIVGEREAELFIPDSNGRIMNQTQMRSAGIGGGAAVHIDQVVVNNQADEDRLIRAISMRLALS